MKESFRNCRSLRLRGWRGCLNTLFRDGKKVSGLKVKGYKVEGTE